MFLLLWSFVPHWWMFGVALHPPVDLMNVQFAEPYVCSSFLLVCASTAWTPILCNPAWQAQQCDNDWFDCALAKHGVNRLDSASIRKSTHLQSELCVSVWVKCAWTMVGLWLLHSNEGRTHDGSQGFINSRRIRFQKQEDAKFSSVKTWFFLLIGIIVALLSQLLLKPDFSSQRMKDGSSSFFHFHKALCNC